jgi:hypothetical protein
MGMTLNSADPKLEALDEVEAALRKIYAAKRDRTATAQDDNLTTADISDSAGAQMSRH